MEAKAVSFVCPSQSDAVRFRQLFQRFAEAVHAGLLIVKFIVMTTVGNSAAASGNITLNQ
jgi:hypothetical protein